jgi:hypothetical protein
MRPLIQFAALHRVLVVAFDEGIDVLLELLD